MTQGVYALIIENGEERYLQIGKLGTFLFLKGLYVYIGSALGKTSTSLEHRLKRHLSPAKKNFWHIDFFLNFNNVKIIKIIRAHTSEKKECTLASHLSQVISAKILIPHFGASDCKRNCGSHLFYFTIEKEKLINLLKSAFSDADLEPIQHDQ